MSVEDIKALLREGKDTGQEVQQTGTRIREALDELGIAHLVEIAAGLSGRLHALAGAYTDLPPPNR